MQKNFQFYRQTALHLRLKVIELINKFDLLKREWGLRGRGAVLKRLIEDYYKSIFPWLQRCEEEFGFDNLGGYGLQRIYGFLAERYMSFWFKKYTKFGVLPIYFKDITYL